MKISRISRNGRKIASSIIQPGVLRRGEKGTPIEFRSSNNILQWRWQGEDSTKWNDLFVIPFNGFSHITVGPTQPLNPSEGDLWIDTSLT